MKTYFTLAFLFTTFISRTQSNFREFTGTGFGLTLPDTGYIYKEGAFINRQTKVSFLLINHGEDFSNIKFNEFYKMMMMDVERPGTTILSNEIVSADSNRIIKTITDYDITDIHPATKGKKDVHWLYFYNYQNKPIVLLVAYDLEKDKEYSDNIYRSLKSLKSIDAASSKKLFKSSFIITDDYAPLKYVGHSFGGIRLNMHGQYRFTGGDSSYCLIIPMSIQLPRPKPDSMRAYLLSRLDIHANMDVAVQSWHITNSGGYVLYEIIAQSSDAKLLYLAIKSDSNGYFEVWGEAYHDNKELIKAFRKIAGSLKRD